MRLTYINDNSYIIMPEVTFTGDFRVSYRTTHAGITIGRDSLDDHIGDGGFSIQLSGNTYSQTGHKPGSGEKDRVRYYHRIWFERKGGTLNTYIGESRETPIETQSVTQDSVSFTYLGRRGGFYEWNGFAWDVLLEDLEDLTSTNNRHYALHEAPEEMVAYDEASGMHGAYSAARNVSDSGIFTKVSNGYRHEELGFLKDLYSYDITKAKVFATFSASVIRNSLFNNRATDEEWKFLKEGAEVEVFQYGSGGEYIQQAIEDTPAYITNLLSKGYLPENITAVVHIGGNDVSGSLPYEDKKDTSDYILNMRSRLEQLYTLLFDAGFTVIWLPLSWRNYGSVPPDSGGSLPYNTDIVHPFIRDVVGDTSWDSVNDAPIYDFYEFTKASFAENSDFLTDSVHPSEYGGEAIRAKFAEWFSPSFPASTVPSSTLQVTIDGIEDGDHPIVLWDFNRKKLAYEAITPFVSGSATVELMVPVGTVITGDYAGDNAPTTGTGTWGVTE